MRTISLPYGHGHMDVHVEEKNLKGTLEVTVSGSNFDSKTTETQYDVFSDFCIHDR